MEKTYELEGLLLLALNREGMMSAELAQLVERKLREIGASAKTEIFPAVEKSNAGQDVAETKSPEPKAQEDKDLKADERAFTDNESMVKNRAYMDSESKAEGRKAGERAEVLNESTAAERKAEERTGVHTESNAAERETVEEGHVDSGLKAPETKEESVEPMLKDFGEEVSDTPATYIQEDTQSAEDSTFYNLEDDEDDIPVRPRQSFKKYGSDSANRNSRQYGNGFGGRKEGYHPHDQGRKRKLPTFSLNDRFLFMREIFEGDASLFNTALNRIAAARSFEEAQDYLVGECGLNPDELDTDARFVAIIRDYFLRSIPGSETL